MTKCNFGAIRQGKNEVETIFEEIWNKFPKHTKYFKLGIHKSIPNLRNIN